MIEIRLGTPFAKSLVVVAALAGCGSARRLDSLPPCDEPAAAALDTTRWRRLDGRYFPSLALPPEFALDRDRAGPMCLHGGVMWSDTTVGDPLDEPRSIGWCLQDGMPRIDSPDSVLRRLPPPNPPKDSLPGDAACVLGFPVLGQRMALSRMAEDPDSTVWRWHTHPLEHGEPLYLLVRSHSRRDEAVVVRALRGMRWVR